MCAITWHILFVNKASSNSHFRKEINDVISVLFIWCDKMAILIAGAVLFDHETLEEIQIEDSEFFGRDFSRENLVVPSLLTDEKEDEDQEQRKKSILKVVSVN